MSHKNYDRQLASSSTYRPSSSQRSNMQIQLKEKETSALRGYFGRKELEQGLGHNIVVQYGFDSIAYENMQNIRITSMEGKNNQVINNLLDVTLILNGKRVNMETTDGVNILQNLARAGYDLSRGECDRIIAEVGIEKWKESRMKERRYSTSDGNPRR